MQDRSTKDGLESRPSLLKVPQVADALSVSTRSVWRLIAQGALTQVRVGKCVRVSSTSLAAFIATGGAH